LKSNKRNWYSFLEVTGEQPAEAIGAEVAVRGEVEE